MIVPHVIIPLITDHEARVVIGEAREATARVGKGPRLASGWHLVADCGTEVRTVLVRVDGAVDGVVLEVGEVAILCASILVVTIETGNPRAAFVQSTGALGQVWIIYVGWHRCSRGSELALARAVPVL